MAVLAVSAVTSLSALYSTLNVTSDFDPETDFDGFQTWGWWRPAPAPGVATPDPRYQSPLVDSRVRKAVDAALAEKGYRRLDAGVPENL